MLREHDDCQAMSPLEQCPCSGSRAILVELAENQQHINSTIARLQSLMSRQDQLVNALREHPHNSLSHPTVNEPTSHKQTVRLRMHHNEHTSGTLAERLLQRFRVYMGQSNTLFYGECCQLGSGGAVLSSTPPTAAILLHRVSTRIEYDYLAKELRSLQTEISQY